MVVCGSQFYLKLAGIQKQSSLCYIFPVVSSAWLMDKTRSGKACSCTGGTFGRFFLWEDYSFWARLQSTKTTIFSMTVSQTSTVTAVVQAGDSMGGDEDNNVHDTLKLP